MSSTDDTDAEAGEPTPPGQWHFITAIITGSLIAGLAFADLLIGKPDNHVSPAIPGILGMIALVALGGPEIVKYLRSKV